jgi:hypothetical protein
MCQLRADVDAAARSDAKVLVLGESGVGKEVVAQLIHRQPFVAHDMRRDDLRAIVQRGLEETRGSYKLLMVLYNMKENDYKRFLQFPRNHQCRLPFHRFRAVRQTVEPSAPARPIAAGTKPTGRRISVA